MKDNPMRIAKVLINQKETLNLWFLVTAVCILDRQNKIEAIHRSVNSKPRKLTV